jgi:hypothetical protein
MRTDRLVPYPGFTRRSFLKAAGTSLAGLALFPYLDIHPAAAESGYSGRVLEDLIPLFDEPSYSGMITKHVWRDLVLPITQVTIGKGEPAYNRIWYRLGQDGYAHSGSIQPVRIEINPTPGDIPADGRLAEISVPYTDARKDALAGADVAYRLYYGTTHWVTAHETDSAGEVWYLIDDDKMKTSYYAEARHVRLIPPEELTPLSPQVALQDKRIEVRLDRQTVTAFEKDRPVFSTRAATGARFSTGDYTTTPGRYIINRKRPTRHMAAGDHAAANSFDLPGVPWVCYFTEDGISLHGTYWHNDFGKTRSHGCVNLSISAARWIYLWTLPVVPAGELKVFEDTGTIVDVI